MEDNDLRYAKELVTLDGIALPRHRWYSVFMILSQCTTDIMECLDHSNPGLMEAFITITDSFVCANTYENIQRFVEHNNGSGIAAARKLAALKFINN